MSPHASFGTYMSTSHWIAPYTTFAKRHFIDFLHSSKAMSHKHIDTRIAPRSQCTARTFTQTLQYFSVSPRLKNHRLVSLTPRTEYRKCPELMYPYDSRIWKCVWGVLLAVFLKVLWSAWEVLKTYPKTMCAEPLLEPQKLGYATPLKNSLLSLLFGGQALRRHRRR